MNGRVMRPGDYQAHLEARLRSLRERGRMQRRRASRWARGWVRIPAGAVILGALVIMAAAITMAVHDAGLVEMDGNVDYDSSPLATDDWNTLFDATGGYTGPAGVQATFVADYFNPTNVDPDFTYHAGSDKDQDDVTTWECGSKSNPTPKDEILNAYAVLSTGTGGSHVGDTILNFGFERPVNNGTSFMGVWFFQSEVGCNSAPSGDTIPFGGAHSDNDILTLVNFTNGGASFNIQVFKWVGTGGAYADGTMDLITSSGECGPSEGDVRVCGKTNTESITTNWPPGDSGLAAHQFFEGGLNITDLLAPEGQEVPCFSTFMAETRTSDVFTAQLKDFAGGSLNTCGKILVDKVTDPSGSSQSFEFDPSYGANFFLTDADPANDSGDLPAGNYSVGEVNIPTDWDLTSATCDNGDDPSSIDLAAGETVTCTFTNTQRGHILVDKVTDPSGSLQSFEFDPSYGANFFLADADAPNDSGGLTAGNYSVAEVNVPAGWSLTGASCDNGDDPSSIDLAAGETVTCTFTNTQSGSIIVEKVTDPTGSLQTFEFDTDYGSNFFLADGGSNNSGGLDPGTYAVAEVNIPADWDLTDATCDDGSDPSAIDLSAGETVTCTFTNTQDGRVDIVKTVSGLPPANGETFNFELRTGASLTEVGTTVASTTTDPVTGEADFGGQTFDPGVYQFCEVDMLPGWHSTLSDDPGAFVPNSDDPGVDNSVVCVEFTLGAGETVTFTIDNTPPPGGDARTIGFWKNWTSCDGHGNQDPVLDDTLASFAGGGILVGDIFVDTCEEAVAILNKSSLDGTKRANDAAYGLAAQLLAAELNYQAGAGQCQAATDAIDDGQALLDLINFNATGSYLGPKVKGATLVLRQQALALAATLDDYNNNLLC